MLLKSLLLILLALLSGCSQTKYKPYNEEEKSKSNFSRIVHSNLDPQFLKEPPQCVVVFQPYAIGNYDFVERIESVLIRHLSGKFLRVIGGGERDFKAIRHGFDLTFPADRMSLSEVLECEAFLEFHLIRPKHSYFLVWSKFEMGIETRLFRQRDGFELWRARHIARRSEGGVPVSPAGLAINAYQANSFSADSDVVDSVSDDLVRRLMASLPNGKSRYRKMNIKIGSVQ